MMACASDQALGVMLRVDGEVAGKGRSEKTVPVLLTPDVCRTRGRVDRGKVSTRDTE
jgi:hypothetical protein